jgi:hypothetical protein
MLDKRRWIPAFAGMTMARCSCMAQAHAKNCVVPAQAQTQRMQNCVVPAQAGTQRRASHNRRMLDKRR